MKKNPNAHSDEFEQKYKRVATLDFTSERKTMSTVIAGPNSNWVLLKGAPERVMEKCKGYFKDNGEQVDFKNDGEKKDILN